MLNPARSLSRHPLFQVMLAFQNNAAVALELDGVAARFEAVSTATSKFDLALSLAETRGADGAPGGIVGTLEYATDLFDEATAAALAERLVRLLEGGAWRAGGFDRRAGDAFGSGARAAAGGLQRDRAGGCRRRRCRSCSRRRRRARRTRSRWCIEERS